MNYQLESECVIKRGLLLGGVCYSIENEKPLVGIQVERNKSELLVENYLKKFSEKEESIFRHILKYVSLKLSYFISNYEKISLNFKLTHFITHFSKLIRERTHSQIFDSAKFWMPLICNFTECSIIFYKEIGILNRRRIVFHWRLYENWIRIDFKISCERRYYWKNRRI